MAQPGVTVKVEVNGLKEALKDINKINPKLRKQFTKDFTAACQPLIDEARSNVPTAPPLSGMENNWKGKQLWTGREAKDIRAKIDTRRARARNLQKGVQYESMGVVKVVAKGRAMSIFDMAGSRDKPTGDRGRVFIDVLNQRFGKASRVMWPASELTLSKVQRNVEPIVDKVMKSTTRDLKG